MSECAECGPTHDIMIGSLCFSCAYRLFLVERERRNQRRRGDDERNMYGVDSEVGDNQQLDMFDE